MDPIEEALENCDNIVVNYNTPKYSPKEQLIATSIGAGVGLVCVGIIIGTGKLLEVTATALYKRHDRKLKKAAEKEAQKNSEQD